MKMALVNDRALLENKEIVTFILFDPNIDADASKTETLFSYMIDIINPFFTVYDSHIFQHAYYGMISDIVLPYLK